MKLKKIYTYDLRFGGNVTPTNIKKEAKKLGNIAKKRGKYYYDIYKKPEKLRTTKKEMLRRRSFLKNPTSWSIRKKKFGWGLYLKKRMKGGN